MFLQKTACVPNTCHDELISFEPAQGWNVIDQTTDHRINLSDALAKIPEKTYHSIDQVLCELKAVL